ncbi:hypothetical protein A2J03_22575 [Rhodococcus sp. EPR-157]|uniref:restriction endonuclease subunit S n=1 Tax=Rhodococcus sp. EPR-157 TaxID=1813677 RepID=UPI0007BB2849|nr:restriction endonuclease subunit S [Rhodococcus sp. EPR-157]KZF07835.1 hypothetical protein A2J03_22575 [Rhodococcus sp. EPR-157]
MTGPLWGDLPNGWLAGQVKNAATVTLGKMLQSRDSGSDAFAPYLRAANVQPDGVLALDDVNEMWFSDSEMDQLSIRAGDVVVVEGGQGGFGRAAYVDEDLPGWGFQNSINRLRPIGNFDGRFISYYLIALRASGFIRAYSNVVSMPHLTAEKLARVPMPLPPPSEQRPIADYLDRETARIDTLIAEQQRLIDLLRERRRAVIDHSVLIDAENVTFSRLFSFHNGDRGSAYPSRDEFALGGVPFVNAGHLSGGAVSYDGMNYVTPEKYRDMGGAKLLPGDILFCLRGSLGKFGYFDGAGGGALASSLVALRCYDQSRIDLRYFLYFLASSSMADAVRLAETGSAQPNLAVEQLARIALPLPSPEEQRTIANHLDYQIAKIDTLTRESGYLIELSKERRSALITAAVTGQIDAREMA